MAGVDPDRVARETDPSDLAEGLYLKVEARRRRAPRATSGSARTFLTAVLDSGSHWLARPIVPNQLADDVTLWSGRSTEPPTTSR